MLLKLRSKVNECKPLNPDQTVKDATGEALKMLWRGAPGEPGAREVAGAIQYLSEKIPGSKTQRQGLTVVHFSAYREQF